MTVARGLLDRPWPRIHQGQDWPPSSWSAETVGTALLVFDALSAIAVTMAPAAPLHGWPVEIRIVLVGLVVGATVAVFAVTPAGKRSGAHLNPAVSLYLTIRGAMPVRDGLAYAVAQLIGSVLGVVAARLCWGASMATVADGLIQPGPGVGAGAVLVGEALSTAVLLLVLSWLVAQPRPRETPWVIGALVAVLIAATGTTTGGSFNPARNFGPHLLQWDFHYAWIYLLAPIGAAVLTAAAVQVTGAWPPRTCKLCGPAFDEPVGPVVEASPLRQQVTQQLELAGFTVVESGPGGGVEIRECPAEHGGGVLVSWAPHTAAFSPIDDRVTAVEKTMAGALVGVMSELGFTASRLGESFSVRVTDADH